MVPVTLLFRNFLQCELATLNDLHFSFLLGMAALISWDDDEGDLKQTKPASTASSLTTTPIRNQQQQQVLHARSSGGQGGPMPIKTNGVNKPKPPHQSSRIR